MACFIFEILQLSGHPNLKLFITHGGLLSVQEATFYQVPILGMPVFGDQFHNIYQAERDGWANVINWNELNEHKLETEIKSTIYNLR